MSAPEPSAPAAAPEAAAEWVDPTLLRPWRGNPRQNAGAVTKVRESIRRFGFGAPVVARRANREIIAGHTRVAAAIEEGLSRVPVRFVDLTERDAHQMALVDNRSNEFASWDDDLLAAAMQHVDEDVARLLDDDAPETSGARGKLQAESVDVSTLTDTQFWLTVRGPLPKQPEALAQLRASLEALGADVEVECGVA